MTPRPFPNMQKAQESETGEGGSVEERPHCVQYEEFLEKRKGGGCEGCTPACELRRAFRGGGREGGTPVLELRLTLGGKVNMAFAERPTVKGGNSTQGRSG